MKPASKRAHRAKVRLNVGPLGFNVDLFGGISRVESPSSHCIGSSDMPHAPVKAHRHGAVVGELVCSTCSSEGLPRAGHLVPAYKADDGSLVLIDEKADAQRVLDVAPLHDVMNFQLVEAEDYASQMSESESFSWVLPSDVNDSSAYLALVSYAADHVLVCSFASRTVAKGYRLKPLNGRLTLVELTSSETRRECPQRNVPHDAKNVDMFRSMWEAVMVPISQEECVALSLDPGREGLRTAANEAVKSGAEVIKAKRTGPRVSHPEKVATAEVVISLAS